MKTQTQQLAYSIILGLVALWIIACAIFYFSGWNISPQNGPTPRALSAEDAALLKKIVNSEPQPLSATDTKTLKQITSSNPAPLTSAEEAYLKSITGKQ